MRKLSAARIAEREGKDLFGVGVHDVPHGGQRLRQQRRDGRGACAPAVRTVHRAAARGKPRLVRLRCAALRAAGQVRLVARKAHEPQLKHGLDLLRRTERAAERIQAVEPELQHRRVGVFLGGDGLEQLGKIASERERAKVCAQAEKLLDRGRFVERAAAAVFKNRHIRIRQQLRRRRDAAALAQRAARADGHLSLVLREHGEDLVRLFVAHLAQDETSGRKKHRMYLIRPGGGQNHPPQTHRSSAPARFARRGSKGSRADRRYPRTAARKHRLAQ